MYILVEQRGCVVYDLYDQEVAIFMLITEAISFIKRQYYMPQQIIIPNKQHYPTLPVINNYYPNQNTPILQNPYHLNQSTAGRHPCSTLMVNSDMCSDNSNFVVNEQQQRDPRQTNPVIKEKFEPTINMTNSMLNEQQLFNKQEYRSQLNHNDLQQQSVQKIEIDEQKLKFDKFRHHLDDVVKKKQLHSNGTESELGTNGKSGSFRFNGVKQSKINSLGTNELEKGDIEQELKSGFSFGDTNAFQQGGEEKKNIHNKKIKTWVLAIFIILAVLIVGFGILGLLVGINLGGISDKIKEYLVIN